METLADAVAAWPKAEIHLHLEGSITPETAVELAARNGEQVTPEEVAARYAYADFHGFLEAFKWVSSLLRRPEDYALVARRLASKLRRQNVVYSEVTLSVGVMLWRNQDASANFAALRAAAEEAGRPDLRMQWIFDAVRQFGPEKAMEVARVAAQHREEGAVAFGLGGDELAVPAEEFRAVYDHVRAHGLHALVHAGEVGGPEEVRRAVEVLGAERIGHGIAAARDPAVMQLLAKRGVALEICPTSNLRTGALARMRRNVRAALRDHPVTQLYRAGVRVTLSTDDPAMFATNLRQEYLAAAEAGLSTRELTSIAEASFEAAFLPPEEKAALATRLRQVLTAQGLVYSERSNA
jgi:adenosine deaminase